MFALYVPYLIVGILSVVDSTNLGVRAGLVAVAVAALVARAYTLYMMFRQHVHTYSLLALAFFSHVILFSTLCILFEGEYKITNPSNIFVDSLFYSVDTITTNGVEGVVPKSALSRLIHIANLLDTYILLTTVGFYVMRNIERKKEK
jgi:hypothetical protein